MPVHPIKNHFTAEVLESEEQELTLENGMFRLAKNNHSKPMRVRVVEISEEFDNDGLCLKIGDEVLISKYGSISITYGKDSKKYQLCNSLDIIGIL